MTQSNINVTQARDNLSEILGRVKFGEEVVTIEKKGKPYAVIISPQKYEAFQKEARRRFGELVQEMQPQTTHHSEEEIAADVKEEVEIVRQELYERGE